MANSFQDFLFPSRGLPASSKPLEGSRGYKSALGLGLVGAGAAALLVCFHWSIALLGALVVLVFSAIESEAFLLFVIFLMPIGWMLPGNPPVRNMNVLFHSLVIVGFFAGRLLRGETRLGHLLHPAVSRASLVFLCAAVAPTILAKGELTRESGRADFDLLAFVGFYFVVLAWVNSRERIRKVLWAVLLSTIITAVFAFYQEIVDGFTSLGLFLYPPDEHSVTWEGRAGSFLGSANNLAGYLNLVLPFALACYVLGRGKWKKIGGCTFLLGSLALFSTQSIGGLMGFLANLVLAIFCFVGSRKKRRALLAGICGLTCILYLLLYIISPVHTQQYLESDAVTRFLLWQTAWNYFVGSPVIGVGWGNFTALYGLDLTSFNPGELAVHNIYLQLLSETGLVGFVSFFYLVIQSWRQARNQLRGSLEFLDSALAFGVLGALLSILVHGFVDFLFHVDAQFGTLCWALMALLVVSGQLQDKSVAGGVRVPSAGALAGRSGKMIPGTAMP